MPSITRRPASSSVDDIEILFDWKHSIFQSLSSACSHRTSSLAFARISRKSAITMTKVRMWEVGKRLWSVGLFVHSGKIFSVLASLESIDALIGSILFNILYSHTLATSPSLIFMLACAFHLFTLPIFRSVNSIFNRERSSSDIFWQLHSLQWSTFERSNRRDTVRVE